MQNEVGAGTQKGDGLEAVRGRLRTNPRPPALLDLAGACVGPRAVLFALVLVLFLEVALPPRALPPPPPPPPRALPPPEATGGG